MKILAKCANCGNTIIFEDIDQVVKCNNCDTVFAIPESNVHTTNEVVLREVKPEIKFPANHHLSQFNSQGGYIWITDYELFFKPHKLNFGDLAKRYIRIQDICGYEKGFLTSLTIKTKKGYNMRLAVWNKDEIINALETKRHAYNETLATKHETPNDAIEANADFEAKDKKHMENIIGIFSDLLKEETPSDI